jgi:hypothetical protein
MIAWAPAIAGLALVAGTACSAIKECGRQRITGTSRNRSAGPGSSTTWARSPRPTGCWRKQATTPAHPGRRAGTAALAEPVRLHPYYAPGSALADLAADVGGHHERLDGSGYPLGLGGQAVSLGVRVLAAADTWAERAGDGPRT